MPAIVKGNSFGSGEFHDYRIGGNVCNAFAIGAIGALDDFFLVGVEPDEATANYPLLTATLLDSDGRLLCRIVRNTLTLNPADCRKLAGDQLGYEIRDSADQPILEIRTVYDSAIERFVTTLAGKFYDKAGQLALRASHGASGEYIMGRAKMAFGIFGESIANAIGFTDDDLAVLLATMRSKGAVYEHFTGRHEGETIVLDGKYLRNAELVNCTMISRTAEFEMVDVRITGGQLTCDPPARALAMLVQSLIASSQTGGQG